ncbi:PREDICTED: uncharacterized protein LOC104810809 [Tarenaya hassleriana]|uniref:uncharacterized protein LOC104810809 n=1 Tax=Tarenaya hassleriana TaxID=28532 RepID=UPI00053C258A|nr:PREDICTED: uncharacterized protein LOC104810809 [Tarenaya hassleriana]
MGEAYMENTPVQLSISSGMEDTGNCFTGDGIRKLRVSRVKDTMTVHGDSDGQSLHSQKKVESSSMQASGRENESSFASIGEAFDKEGINVTLGGHPYGNEDSSIMAFDEINDEHDIGPGSQAVGGGYHPYGHQSPVQTSEMLFGQELEASHTNVVVSARQVAKPRSESLQKNKTDAKMPRKEAPTSFPSNVRSLISTGMLDGVPVKYMSLSREELRGIIQGSGYLCGCEDCNFSKVLNAYAFERHAGCKTKHPNNHIYFENGKTIYQIVQELRNTPESMLFDVIQTVFGSPINQKAFRSWKESFQAATRELQRIYGKEDG